MKTNRKFSSYYIKKNIVGIIFGICLFLSLMPYFVWGKGSLILITNIIILIFSLFYVDNNEKLLLKNLMLLPVLFLLILYSEKESNFVGLILGLYPLAFFFIKKEKLILIYKWFKLIFAISILLSLVIFIAKMLSVPISYNVIEPLNPGKNYNYYQYPFLVSPSINISDILGSFRFFGMFDEPGVIGTFCAIMLINDKFKMNSLSNKILLLGGLASASFFFIGMSLVFMFFYINNKMRFLTLAILVTLFFQTKDNPIIYGVVWERFEVVDGKIKGDNRMKSGFEEYYKSYIKSDELYVGKGKYFEEKHGIEGSSNYKQLVLRYGVIFTVVLVLFYLIYAMVTIKKNKGVFVFMILFLAILYNRPFIFSPVYTFIIIASIIINKENLLTEFSTKKNRCT